MSTVCPDIEQDSTLWDALVDAEAIAERAIEAAREQSGITLLDGAELGLLLSDNAHVQSVNREWRGLDKPTNVLSFPAVEPSKLARAPFLGDIIIAYETVETEARLDSKSFADHFAHLVVHGFLHLLGYDHVEEADAQRMEALEIAILASLDIPDPYADRPLAAQKGRS
jgi:probable rRNA maturation factor